LSLNLDTEPLGLSYGHAIQTAVGVDGGGGKGVEKVVVVVIGMAVQ
jgi:hypothetical protein